ncbi:hypothetical protein HanIR_Chr13g0663061 [Helianthus annuus]|nr:hypothetical protein HanIR_Chr13g0663061 [Helianthus annuus]
MTMIPTDKTPVKPEVRDRFSGTVESFARRTGLHGEYSRHRSSEHATPSKEMVSCPNSRLSLMTCHRSFGKIHISCHLHLSYNIIVTQEKEFVSHMLMLTMGHFSTSWNGLGRFDSHTILYFKFLTKMLCVSYGYYNNSLIR